MIRPIPLALVAFGCITVIACAQHTRTSPEAEKALGRVEEASLKKNLTFIASDDLQGRATPSPGLDKAADYIAAQFKAAGLEPLGSDGYFQTGNVTSRGVTGTARNVIGILRGADPVLKDTYILVTAHYDHLGVKRSGEGDLIYNGANDDGSGTVGVIELAKALSGTRLKRSIVFMTYYGEERGGFGSSSYVKDPAVPIAKTIANINLEQIGRTDDQEGKRVAELSMTGFDYSDLGTRLDKSAAAVGVKVTKHPVNSDAFFFRSDNASLAFAGVPAHTVSVAFEYPDYHGVDDEVDKIDFPNTVKVLKGLVLGLIDLANSAQEPRWNAENPKAARYLEAWKKNHGN